MKGPIAITDDTMCQIEAYSAGLSKDEVLAMFYRTMQSLSEEERDRFEAAYARGRAIAKSNAVTYLFDQMRGKDGVKGALSYLVRFADEWPVVEDEGTKDGEHSFKVVFPHMK